MAHAFHADLEDLKKSLSDQKACMIVDVREAAEFSSQHVAGSVHIALSRLRDSLPQLSRDLPLYLICSTGVRSQKAAEILAAAGFADLRVVKGGLEAWMKDGNAVEGSLRPTWSLERQVRLVAGGLVLLGFLLGLGVHVYFLGLSVLVGAGLVYSALTNTCGMAMFLARLPWNRG